MTKKNIALITSICVLIAGVAIGYFANFASSDIVSFAVTLFAAGSACCTLWEKRSKTNWMTISSPALVGIGAFVLGFGGFSESTMTTVITSVAGIAAVVAGLITAAIASAKVSSAINSNTENTTSE